MIRAHITDAFLCGLGVLRVKVFPKPVGAAR